MENCIFCKIARKEMNGHIIYEDKYYIALLDVNPIVYGHTLLIPKRHYKTIFDLGEEETKNLGRVIKYISDILNKEFGPNINISNTSGKYASQSVEHFHFHFIPRKKDDRLRDGEKSKIILDRSSGFERLKPSDEDLEELCKRLKA